MKKYFDKNKKQNFDKNKFINLKKLFIKMSKILPYSQQALDKSDINNVVKVLRSNFITQGPEINKFEKIFLK